MWSWLRLQLQYWLPGGWAVQWYQPGRPDAAVPPGPVLREYREGQSDGELYIGEFWQEWYCEPPPEGITFVVTREEWDLDTTMPARKIYGIREIEPSFPV